MKNIITLIVILSTLISCLSTKNTQIGLPDERVSETTFRLSSKDTALFELIYVNNTDQARSIGSSYGDYDVEFMIFDDSGKQLNRINGTSSSSVRVDPGERIIISDFITIIIQGALIEAKMDELTFGNYTVVWKPYHLGLNHSIKVTYDQGDIDYLIDFKKRIHDAAVKEYEKIIKNK